MEGRDFADEQVVVLTVKTCRAVRIADVAHDMRRASCIAEDFAQQRDGRRFAVRAGDADDLHFAAGVAVEVPRGKRKTETAVVRLDVRHVSGGRFLAQHGGAALFHRHGDIFMSVRFVPAHGDEKVTALHAAGIVADARDLRIAGGGCGENIYFLENFR